MSSADLRQRRIENETLVQKWRRLSIEEERIDGSIVLMSVYNTCATELEKRDSLLLSELDSAEMRDMVAEVVAHWRRDPNGLLMEGYLHGLSTSERRKYEEVAFAILAVVKQRLFGHGEKS